MVLATVASQYLQIGLTCDSEGHMAGIGAAAWIKRVIRRQPTGQVGAGSDLGRWIEHLSSIESVVSIVEIGTWRGNGTTRRIADGFARRSRQNAAALCLEVDREMAAEAAARFRGNPAIKVVWGRVVGAQDVDDSALEPQERGWLEADLESMAISPNVLDMVPTEIDLLILDGGEFTTQAEYALLKSRVTGWIALDDTRTRKCREIVRRLLGGEDPDFAVVEQSEERNGIMIVRRIARA